MPEETLSLATESPISNGVAGQSVHFRFTAGSPGNLLRRESATGEDLLAVSIVDGHLRVDLRSQGEHRVLDAEDADQILDEQEHSVAVVRYASGTLLYLDGYEVFSSTSTLPLPTESDRDVFGAPGSPTVTDVQWSASSMPADEIRGRARAPRPFVEFAAARLSDRDASRVGQLHEGSVRAKFRVRGEKQGGTILHASGSEGQLRLSIIDGNIEYLVTEGGSDAMRIIAHGHWDDGSWHDVVVTSGYGATHIYVDGYQVGRAPGVCFFADARGIDAVSVGMDLSGSRLFGEAHVAMIYDTVLADRQVKLLAGATNLHSEALFDSGYEGSVSYRIPSLITLKSGALIAGADQRTSIANDSPNHINFVVRRSLDGGQTWEPLRTVITSEGQGAKGASVIDSLMVQDRESGDLIVLIDHFPGGVGQPNAQPGVGYDESGRRLLFDRQLLQYTVESDGSVIDAHGENTPYTVGEDLHLFDNGRDLGSIDLCESDPAAPPLVSARTSYLWMVRSSDDGETWSAPVDITPQVKQPWMRFLGTSPGNGIQIKHGEHKGRLVMPVYYNHEEGITFSCAAVVSDDGGNTWKLGASPNDNRRFEGQTLNSRTLRDDRASLHESVIVESAPGELTVFMRNQHQSGLVGKAISKDGGLTWGPVEYDPQLTEIFSQPNAIEISGEKAKEIVFANASQMLPFRGCGVLRLSDDGGRSWPHNRVFNPRHYVYQAMAPLADDHIGLLWEREWHGLFFARIPAQWLRESQSTVKG